MSVPATPPAPPADDGDAHPAGPPPPLRAPRLLDHLRGARSLGRSPGAGGGRSLTAGDLRRGIGGDRRRAALLAAALPDARYPLALAVGALDASTAAALSARCGHCDVRRGGAMLAARPPTRGRYDLVAVVDALASLDDGALDQARAAIYALVRPAGVIAALHPRVPPGAGRATADVLHSRVGDPRHTAHVGSWEEPAFRIDLWRRRG
jgi:hypothetical protein